MKNPLVKGARGRRGSRRVQDQTCCWIERPPGAQITFILVAFNITTQLNTGCINSIYQILPNKIKNMWFLMQILFCLNLARNCCQLKCSNHVVTVVPNTKISQKREFFNGARNHYKPQVQIINTDEDTDTVGARKESKILDFWCLAAATTKRLQLQPQKVLPHILQIPSHTTQFSFCKPMQLKEHLIIPLCFPHLQRGILVSDARTSTF